MVNYESSVEAHIQVHAHWRSSTQLNKTPHWVTQFKWIVQFGTQFKWIAFANHLVCKWCTQHQAIERALLQLYNRISRSLLPHPIEISNHDIKRQKTCTIHYYNNFYSVETVEYKMKYGNSNKHLFFIVYVTERSGQNKSFRSTNCHLNLFQIYH